MGGCAADCLLKVGIAVNRQCILGKALCRTGGCLNLVCRRTDQVQLLDMGNNFRSEHVIRDMLIVSAGDQNHLFLKCAQTRNGSGRAGCNRIIIIAHAVLDAYQLNAVLYAAEILCNRTDILKGGIGAGQADGRKIVCHIVLARDLDISLIHNLGAFTVFDEPHLAVLEIGAAFHRSAHGEAVQLYALIRLKRLGNFIICIEHQDVACELLAEYIGFCLNILCHVCMLIQMIRRDVSNNCGIRSALHLHQLERGQLDNRIMLRAHLRNIRQQRMTDIAAEMAGIAGVLQDLIHQRCRRGLAVRTGNRNDRARADAEEHLHLAGDDAAVCRRLFQSRIGRKQSRRAENIVTGQIFEIILSNVECNAQLAETGIQLAELVSGLLVVYCDICTRFQQQAD